MAKKKVYAVYHGRKTGIFNTWNECKEQTDYFKGARYKSFGSLEEAEASFQDTRLQMNIPQKVADNPPKNTFEDYRFSVSVDASSSGNPGKVEYQGVDTKTGAPFFKSRVYPLGTNNLGEFLAIVHGLGYLAERHLKEPVYSDSNTAINWVKKGKVNSSLVVNNQTKEIWDHVKRAEKWLKRNPDHNPVLKWHTDLWGEIKADFGRK